MKNILCIGDPHFRVDNIEETQQFTSNLSKYLDENEIDTIIVMGDVLHTHEKIHTFALNAAFDFFKMLSSKNKPVYSLVGNHDATSNTIFLTNNHWMNVLKGWKNLTIVDYPLKVQVENNFIVLCPYVPDGRFKEALNHIDEWKESICIFGHQLIDGAKMGMIVAKDVENWNENYPMLVSGHIHDKQWIGKNVYYTGSSLQHGFGETGDKSLSLVKIPYESDGKNNILVEEIYLEIKKKKIIYADVSDLDEIKEKLNEDIEYKIVLSGNENDFKALKNSSLYKDTLKLDNIKDIKFKTKIKKDENQEDNKVIQDDFVECLNTLIERESNPYLTSLYEHVIYGKEDISDKDIFFM
jgi:DNA repair exonuclease SbcCD nuclease subunit